MTSVLIDADIFVYRAAHSAQREYEWDFEGPTLTADLEEGIALFKDLVDKVLLDVPGARPVICLSDSEPSFRRDFWPSYKGNRSTRPLLYDDIRAWATALPEYRVFLRPRLEADDIIGILATHPTLVPGEKVIFSGDKDLQQVPGLHLTKEGIVVPIPPDEADYFFWTQILTGDAVDNYPGCPGIGPVKARKILAEGLHWPAVVAAYEARGLTAEDALIQARCARILRAEDYNFKKKEPILWHPTQYTPYSRLT